CRFFNENEMDSFKSQKRDYFTLQKIVSSYPPLTGGIRPLYHRILKPYPLHYTPHLPQALPGQVNRPYRILISTFLLILGQISSQPRPSLQTSLPVLVIQQITKL